MKQIHILRALVAYALVSIACQPACANPLPAPQNSTPPPLPPSPPPTRWPPSTPPNPPANGKTGRFPFGYYYPTVTVIGVPRAVYGIPTQSSGPKGEDGCLYYRIDTNELVNDLWAPTCDPAAQYWWFTAMLWIVGLAAVISSPWIFSCSLVGFKVARDWCKLQKHRVKTAVRNNRLFGSPRHRAEQQVSSALSSAPAVPSLTQARTAEPAQTPAGTNPLLPGYDECAVIQLRPRAGVSARRYSFTDPRGARLIPSASSSSPAPATTTRSARFANAYLTANPHGRFSLTLADFDLMTDPSSWTFAPPIDTDTLALLADVSAQNKSITIRATSPFASADKFKFNAISFVTNLPVAWFPSDADIGPPASAGASIRYFEVTLVHLDASACTFAIGLSTAPYPYFGLPGLHPWSIALHSTAGDVYSSIDGEFTPVGAPYAQKPIRTGDTIGVGLDTARASVFFTRNGSRMQSIEGAQVPKPAQWMVKPCIGVSVNVADRDDGASEMEPCVLKWNFGTSEFAWSEGQGMGYGVEMDPPAYTDVSRET